MMGWTVVAPWITAVLLSLPLDMLATPQVRAWHQRSARSVLLHLAAVTALFMVSLCVWGRAWFAMVCTVGLLGILVTINQAKYKALREPVVFSDLALFAQSIRHPRLYFPYLSRPQVLAPIPAVTLLALLFWLDPTRNPIPTVVVLLVWLVLLWAQFWLSKGLKVSLNPAQDQANHGFFCSFVAYLFNGLSVRELNRVHAQLDASPYANISIKTGKKSARTKPDAPDVVVIQSESFFDIRKNGLSIAPWLLNRFDSLQRSAISSGALAVPAWGANTMRTEHAFLSGIPNAALGYASFYPYAFVSKATLAMPRAFQLRGYRCTAVHPYPADFFLRHRVFPRLGFDEFVDEAHFANAAHEGPYVADSAVTDWLIQKLERPKEQPQFLFAITMENHGPLHLEKATAAEASSLYKCPDGQAIHDLTVYLRHIANADQMMGRLQDFLSHRQRKTLLCFYGDHVPAMTHVYNALGVTPQHSDYFIWCNHQIEPRQVVLPQLRTPEQLGLKLAKLAGLV